jgi:hypothetical protein
MDLIAIGFNASQCGPRTEIFLQLFLVTSGPGSKAPGCTAAIRLIVHPVF